MGISYENAKARVKTGKSCAIRCAQCGEMTIGDHFVDQVISNVKYQGMEVSSSLSEKGDAVICRLCGAIRKVPPQATPITWEEFDLALASEELMERTNPRVASEVALPCPDAPRSVSRPVAALLEYLRQNCKTAELLPVPTMIFVGGLIAAVAGGNVAHSATESIALGWVAGILIGIAAAGIGVVVNFRQSLDVLADKHGTFVCRFLNEMNMELKQLMDASISMGSRYTKVGAILGRIPEFYDV